MANFGTLPAPTGLAAAATITMWEMDGARGSFHDLELGRDGRVYAVNIQNGKLIALDTESGEQTTYKYPKGATALIQLKQLMMEAYGRPCVQVARWFASISI